MGGVGWGRARAGAPGEAAGATEGTGRGEGCPERGGARGRGGVTTAVSPPPRACPSAGEVGRSTAPGEAG